MTVDLNSLPIRYAFVWATAFKCVTMIVDLGRKGPSRGLSMVALKCSEMAADFQIYGNKCSLWYPN